MAQEALPQSLAAADPGPSLHVISHLIKTLKNLPDFPGLPHRLDEALQLLWLCCPASLPKVSARERGKLEVLPMAEIGGEVLR